MLKSIRINFKDGSFKDLVLSKATEVKTKTKMINLDQLRDGTWRIIYDADTINDLGNVMNLELVRETITNEFKGKKIKTSDKQYYDDHECA